MTTLEKAVNLSLEKWSDSLPELSDIPTYEFSKRHKNKMKRLINKMRVDRYHLLTTTEEKVVYVVLTLIIVLLMIIAFHI